MHDSSHTIELPWYKQFWPWFIIGLPLAAVCLSLTLLTISFKTRDDMVTRSYYQQGLAINEVIGAIEQARSLALSARLLIINDNSLRLQLDGDLQPLPPQLVLEMKHRRNQRQDTQLTLQLGEDGIYHALLPTLEHSYWHIDIHPLAESPDWQIKSSAYFPAHDIVLKP